MEVKILWNVRDWAEAVAELPVAGPLPCRTVLVPRERVAHVLRRDLIRSGRSDALAGTRFLPMLSAAVEVLRADDRTFEPGEEALRRARLTALFRSQLQLGHFPLDLLRDRPGWDEAFARTISDLEGAGLRPAHLESAGASAQLRDVASIWHALDESAGRCWTAQRIFLEAAAALEREPALWPFTGAVLAFAAGDITVAEARFVRTIPAVTLGLLAARPARERYLQRTEALLGDGVGEALRSATAPRAGSTERDLLVSYLFEPPSVLANSSRPRSNGPDGTVDLEEHSGAEAEIEATADWVARQVADRTPLEEIAILVPALDPLAGLVTERVARLPWQDGPLPVHVAGGLLLVGHASGARALAVVSALRAYLSAESLVGVLPALRSSATDGRHLSHGAATALVWSLGTVGGNPAKPDGALEWSARAKERESELDAEIARARADEETDGAGAAREIERSLADLRAIRPALEALVGVVRYVIDGAPLAVLWLALRDFLEAWLLQPVEGPRVHALLDDRLSVVAAESACGALSGEDALRVIEETVTSTRVPSGRFGEPMVYVGTVREAVGLCFRAVRVIGLSEGHLPSVSREDPVVPDLLRETLTASASTGFNAPPATAAERALEDLHALDMVVRNARERVALSAARLDIDRSQRELSSVMLEAAAALARPNRITGKQGATIPDAAALSRDGFAPAREVAVQFRKKRPLGEAAWQDEVSRRAVGVPPRWRGVAALDLDRIALLRAPDGSGPMDGILGAAGIDLPVPGLSAEWPISPSAVATLLRCPHEFLLGNVLRFHDRVSAPPQREIGQPHYGNLFHKAAAEFYNRHGTSFCAGHGTLRDWLSRAGQIVERLFDEFLRQYPLVGDAVRSQERERLQRDLHELLCDEWENTATGHRFIAAERAFGRPTGVELSLGERALFVRGRIDRIDVVGRKTFVLDLKTGRAYPRAGKGQDPDPALDLQIAIYGLVAQVLAEQWKIPKRVAAAYAYVGRSGKEDRSYRDDFHDVLEPAARGWLAIAIGLLAERFFPRTPSTDDCNFCRFSPVCGDEVYERAAALLANTDGVLTEFAALKVPPAKDGED